MKPPDDARPISFIYDSGGGEYVQSDGQTDKKDRNTTTSLYSQTSVSDRHGNVFNMSSSGSNVLYLQHSQTISRSMDMDSVSVKNNDTTNRNGRDISTSVDSTIAANNNVHANTRSASPEKQLKLNIGDTREKDYRREMDNIQPYVPITIDTQGAASSPRRPLTGLCVYVCVCVCL